MPTFCWAAVLDVCVQEFLLLGRSGLLLKQDYQKHERQIECNMQSAACFHTRTPCISLCSGKPLTWSL